MLYPRNQGTSDRAAELNYTTMADDVVRFMWEHKISTATLAGHGLGAKLALATGCYHAERVTGVMALDSSPMNQSFVEAYRELNGYLQIVKDIDTSRSANHVTNELKKSIKCPKWREILEDNIVKQANGVSWDFNLNVLAHNLRSKGAESLLNWESNMGLWTGRAMFAFPEYSRHVFLSTNTLPMMKVCTQLKGFGEDIFAIQGDENPLSNHRR